VLITPTESRGKWGELLEHPLTRPFDGEAPGDHVEVEVSGVAIQPGDTVAILGEEDAHLEPDGYRGAKEIVRAFEAQVVARGDDPEDALSRWQQEEADARQRAEEAERKARRAARERPPDIPAEVPLGATVAGVGLLVIGLALALTESGPAHLRGVLPGTGIVLAAIALLVYRRRRYLPVFSTPSHRARHDPARWSSPELTSVIAFGGPLVGVALAGVLFAGSGVVGRALAGAAGVLAFLFALRLLWDGRHGVRFLRMLLRTPEYRPGDSGMRTLVISLDKGRLLRDVDASKRDELWTSWEFLRDDETNHANQFELAGRTADGTEVHVQPGGANFASLRRTAEMKRTDTAIEVRVREEITAGDEVLVLGRPEKSSGVLKVSATGPESLVILGAGADVRTAARRRLAGHRAAVSSMLGLAATGLLLAYFNPFVTHDVFEGQVTSVTGRTQVQAGDHCTLEIGHDGTQHEMSCQVRLECGGVRLYGGPFSGYLECSVRNNRWVTSTSDPELGFIPPNHVETRRNGSVVQVLIDR
jgi:hypothetical protein